MNHTKLLNHLVAKHNLKSYLEIGVQNPANNFLKINVEKKYGVDPEIIKLDGRIFKATSDDFFKYVSGVMNGRSGEVIASYDLIFIDGFHEHQQVKRDFDNSLRCLNDGGFIVIHDTLPKNEEGSLVPRVAKRWWGDVYKFVMTLKQYDGIDFVTHNFDEGCTVVWKDATKKGLKGSITPNWDNYIKHRKEALNITDEPVTI